MNTEAKFLVLLLTINNIPTGKIQNYAKAILEAFRRDTVMIDYLYGILTVKENSMSDNVLNLVCYLNDID